jgi:predicted RNase H-like HicB family nuclease
MHQEAFMLTTYIRNAMRLAKYEILDDGQYYGEIPGFDGVWAQADNLETCREELQSALEDWLVLGLRLGHKLPAVGGVQLVPAGA